MGTSRYGPLRDVPIVSSSSITSTSACTNALSTLQYLLIIESMVETHGRIMVASWSHHGRIMVWWFFRGFFVEVVGFSFIFFWN